MIWNRELLPSRYFIDYSFNYYSINFLISIKRFFQKKTQRWFVSKFKFLNDKWNKILNDNWLFYFIKFKRNQLFITSVYFVERRRSVRVHYILLQTIKRKHIILINLMSVWHIWHLFTCTIYYWAIRIVLVCTHKWYYDHQNWECAIKDFICFLQLVVTQLTLIWLNNIMNGFSS